MFPRLRVVTVGLVFSGILAFSLFAVVSSGAAAKAGGKVVSAKLTPKTSFTAAQAKTIKLKCKFSPATKRAVFLLQVKKGSKWAKVRSVTKKGSIKAYTSTVKKLFGSKAVKVGKYRVKVSADANSVTRKFSVVKTTSGGVTRPLAGRWTATNGVYFYVMPDQANVIHFDFSFDWSFGGSCFGHDENWTITAVPIADGSFSKSSVSVISYVGAGDTDFGGTFDSPTTAHGTVTLLPYHPPCAYINQFFSEGPLSWTATRQDASQPS